jgi:hypothetical protein
MHSDLLPNPPLEPTAEKRGGSAAAALGYHALGARPAVRLPAVVLERSGESGTTVGHGFGLNWTHEHESP